MKRCNECGAKSDPGAHFCSACGALLSVKSEKDGKIGEVVINRGIIDNSRHTTKIDQQINFNSPIEVKLNRELSTPNYEELLHAGINYLRRKEYTRAKDFFNQAILTKPENPSARYYHALASLRGHKPEELTRIEIEAIEHELELACQFGNIPANYYYLWAWVKERFYGINHYLEPQPLVKELVNQAQHSDLTAEQADELIEIARVSGGLVEAHILRRKFAG